MTQPTAEQTPRKRTWLVVVLVLAGACGLFLFIAVPLAIYGVRKYLIQAKAAEGRNAVTALAQGIAKCQPAVQVAGRSALPPTAQPVPRELTAIQGMKYQSVPGEW